MGSESIQDTIVYNQQASGKMWPATTFATIPPRACICTTHKTWKGFLEDSAPSHRNIFHPRSCTAAARACAARGHTNHSNGTRLPPCIVPNDVIALMACTHCLSHQSLSLAACVADVGRFSRCINFHAKAVNPISSQKWVETDVQALKKPGEILIFQYCSPCDLSHLKARRSIAVSRDFIGEPHSPQLMLNVIDQHLKEPHCLPLV